MKYEVFTQQIKGRGLQSTQTIKETETIFEEKSYASALRRDYVFRACANCMLVPECLISYIFPASLTTCNSCSKISYCSEICRKEDEHLHSIECQWLQKYNLIPTVSARLYGRILIKKKIKTEWKLKTLFSGEFDRFPDEDKKLHNDSLNELKCYIPRKYELSTTETNRLMRIITLNGVTISGYETPDIGVGIFPTFSLINHSCRPNICRSFLIGNIIRLYAISEISPKTELTSAYIDISTPTSTRNAELSTFQMKCNCELCLEKPSPMTACFNPNHDEIYVVQYYQRLSTLLGDIDTTNLLQQLKSIEMELSQLFPPTNCVWTIFYSNISGIIRSHLNIEVANEYAVKILEYFGKVHSKYAYNYYIEIYFICVLSLNVQFRLPLHYYTELIDIVKIVYGPRDKIVDVLQTIFKAAQIL